MRSAPGRACTPDVSVVAAKSVSVSAYESALPKLGTRSNARPPYDGPVAERESGKAELLEALRRSRDEVVGIVRGLPPERLEDGRYENGWNGRQILAHLASIEWTYPRLIDIARDAPAPESAPASSAGELPTRTMRGGNDAYNDRQVARRAHRSVAELLAEFEQNRDATIRAVEAADDGLFARRIRSAGGVVGPLAEVFHQVAVVHVLGHARDIAGSTRR
jgi:hypothetical protein